MSTLQSTVTWTDGMAFRVDQGGHTFMVDAHEEHGGRGLGVQPKTLLLTSLLGCTGMDVVAILSKMRVPIDSFSVHADGDLTDEHPKRFSHIVLRYAFTGPAELSLDRIRRAVFLSETRYCGVMATLRDGVDVSTEISVNGAIVPAWEESAAA